MSHRKTAVYLLFLAPQLIWLLLILAAPYLASAGDQSADLLYFGFSETCHQMPERSFFAFGHKMAVCARCFGIYLGAFLATLAYPLALPVDNKKTPSKYLLIAGLLPMALDGGLQLLTSYESTNLLRLATGLVAGAVCALLVYPVYNSLVYGFLDRKQIY